MEFFSGKILWIGLLVLLPAIYAGAQPGLSAVAIPAEVGLDEFFQYKIVLENATDLKDLSAPVFRNFAQAGGVSQEKGISAVNGDVKRYVAFVFNLKPLKTGKFTIPPVTATINGKPFKSNPVTVTVIRQSQGAGLPFPLIGSVPERKVNEEDYILHAGEKVEEKAQKNMQVRLEVDRTTCYVGEPVVATYKLFTRLKTESKLSQNPSFNGFSVIDLQQGNGFGYATELLNGKEYNVYIIRKSQLYPLQPGLIEIEPAELENNLQFVKEDYASRQPSISPFLDDLSMGLPPDAIVSQTITLRSKPVSITVKALPEEGKPVSFNGAVGSFTLNASLQKNDFSTDESGLLTVVISGTGNMQLITPPDIDWPAGIEGFEPKVVDKLINTQVPVGGSKAFEFSFSANREGEFEIPPVSFSYFDPKTGKYKLLTSKSIPFSVRKGTGEANVVKGDIIKVPETSFINSIFQHRSWIIVFLSVMVILGVSIWISREKKKSPPPENVNREEDNQHSRMVNESALAQQNPFVQTEKCLQADDCIAFYSLLNGELKKYLAYKFSLDPGEINTSTLARVMDKKGISNETVLELQSLMREIEWQLYTPFERNERMVELYQKVQGVTQLVNTYFTKTQ